MANPWLKKNPFMSVWLSGANSIAGSARAHAKRQAATAMTQATNDITQFWTNAMAPSRAAKKKRR